MNEQPPQRHNLPSAVPIPRDQVLMPEPGFGFIPPEEAEESALRQYWRTLYKRRHIILAIAALGFALGLIISMLTQPEYAGTVTVQVAREEAKVLNIEGVEDEGGTARYDPEFYQTQYALLKSRFLSEDVARDLRLADNHQFLAEFDADKVDEVSKLPREQRLAKATKLVNDNTSVTPIRLSSIINITHNSPNPQLAAAIANSIADNYVQSNLDRRFEAAAYARQFLQTRLNQVRARLEESERRAVAYAQREGLIKIRAGEGDSASEQSIVAQDLTTLSEQLALARAQRAQAEAQFRSGTGGNIAAQSLTHSTLNDLRRQRAELLGQLSKLESDFGPEYPAVIALRSQIRQLDQQIGNEQARVSSSVSQDMGGRYRQALAAERALQGRVDALKGQLLGEQQRSIQFNIIQRDVDTNRALYDALLQRFKEVGVAGGVGTNNISVVDKALPPARPFKPNLPLNIALGLLLGLICGAVAAIILEHLEDSALMPRDLPRKLGVPLLGVTPRLGARGENAAVRAPKVRVPLLGSTPEVASPGAVAASLSQPKSPLSEAYFSILTSLQFSTNHGAPTTVMLTSAQAREGKSTTSLALALGLASVGSRVLLIDADMRNPSLHKMLGRGLAGGLSNLLTGQGKLEDHVQKTDNPNLTVLLAGQVPPNPAELLSTDAIHDVLAAATSAYDHVVVDAPPVLGLADAPLLSKAVEAVVLVVEASRTPAVQARHALDRLLAVRAHVIGAILTKFDVKSAGYGYGYGYDYRYGEA